MVAAIVNGTDIPFQWKIRMQGQLTLYRCDQLLAHPDNAYIHRSEQGQALASVLNQIGWVAPIILNTTTQHVLDGTQRVLVALASNQKYVPVVKVSLTVEEEQVIINYFNAIGKMCIYDLKKMDENMGVMLKGKFAKLVNFLNKLNVLPVKGNRLMSITEQRNAPLELQGFIKQQTAKGKKELWGIGNARLFGTPEECAPIIEKLKASGVIANKLGGDS